jgi:monoamine oxidase
MELIKVEKKMSSFFERGMREDAELAREFRHLKHMSFKDWVTAQKTTRFVQEWIRICIEPEMATEWDKISAAEGFFEYEKFLGEKGLPNFHINYGTQDLTDELARQIGKDKIITEAQVKKIINGSSSVKVQYKNALGETLEIEAKHVVSTIPALNLMDAVEIVPPLSQKKKMAINTMARGRYMKAHLLFKEDAKKYWMTSEGHSMLPILTDASLGVIYSGNPDKTSKSKTQVLTLLFYGAQAEEYAKLSSEEIQKRMESDLDRFFPGIREYLIQSTVQRRFTPISIASWPVGRARNDHLAEALKQAEGRLTISGDFTESTHSEGAGRAALRAIEQIKHTLEKEHCSENLRSKTK